MFAQTLAAAAATALLAAQAQTVLAADSCQSDVLIDDFSTIRPFYAGPPDNEWKRLNALDGGWGQYGGNFTIDTAAKTLTIDAQNGSTTYYADDTYNPDTVPTYNWFYFQFSNQTEQLDFACYDLTNYTGISMTVEAPEGADFNITLTQRLADDCNTRTYDSEYHLFSEYYTTPGQQQRIFLPFKDFSTDLSGAPFHFKTTKDVTFINLNPFGSKFVLRDVVLNGNCPTSDNSTTGGNSSNGTTSGDDTKKNSASTNAGPLAALSAGATLAASVVAYLFFL